MQSPTASPEEMDLRQKYVRFHSDRPLYYLSYMENVRDVGSITKVRGTHGLRGTLAGFLEVGLCTLSEAGTRNETAKHFAR